MALSSAQLCGRTVRCAVEAMETRDEIKFRKKLARIFRKNSVDRSASLFGYAGGECRDLRIAPGPLNVTLAGRLHALQDSTKRRTDGFARRTE